MSCKRLLNAYLLFWSRGPCFRIISRKVGIRFGLGGNIASSQGVLVFNIIVVICANKRLLGSFYHIWKSLFMFAQQHQQQGTKSEPWIELNIWGEDIMSGNSLSRHIPEQLRNINSRQYKLNRGKFVFIIVNGFSCVNAYLWIHFIFCTVGIICKWWPGNVDWIVELVSFSVALTWFRNAWNCQNKTWRKLPKKMFRKQCDLSPSHTPRKPPQKVPFASNVWLFYNWKSS